MSATTMSRIIAALSALTLLGACNDTFSPSRAPLPFKVSRWFLGRLPSRRAKWWP
jgi:hypothetical protein